MHPVKDDLCFRLLLGPGPPKHFHPEPLPGNTSGSTKLLVLLNYFGHVDELSMFVLSVFLCVHIFVVLSVLSWAPARILSRAMDAEGCKSWNMN